VWIYPRLRFNKEVSDYNGFNISCHGKSDGFISIDPASDTAPFKFKWSGPGGFKSTSKDLADLLSGQYSLTLTGSNMCTIADTLTLSEPDPLQVSYEIREPSCPGSRDGIITLDVTGGIPGSLYYYHWSDNSTGKGLLNVPQGSYKVIVTDQNGCSAHEDIILKPKSEVCLKIPDAFSPNGDGINDVWNIIGKEFCPDIEVTIYNRWGQVVWKSVRGYPVSWFCMIRGKELPVDSYHYYLDFHDGTRLIIGTVTIVR